MSSSVSFHKLIYTHLAIIQTEIWEIEYYKHHTSPPRTLSQLKLWNQRRSQHMLVLAVVPDILYRVDT